MSKLVYMRAHKAKDGITLTKVGESKNGGKTPSHVLVQTIGRAVKVGDTFSYARKATKREINSELTQRGWHFNYVQSEKCTHITREDGAYLIHDHRARLFERVS